MNQEDCIFCKIISGKISSTKVYEDEKFISFMDIMPANKGHLLIVPKKHCTTFADLPDDIIKEINILTQKIAKAMYTSLKPDGYNCFHNNHPAAGQVVPHFHVHVVPRYDNDGIIFDWPKRKYENNEMQEISKKIKKSLEI